MANHMHQLCNSGQTDLFLSKIYGMEFLSFLSQFEWILLDFKSYSSFSDILGYAHIFKYYLYGKNSVLQRHRSLHIKNRNILGMFAQRLGSLG